MTHGDEGLVWEAIGSYTGPESAKLFVRYVAARYARRVVTDSYREYVTDSLRLIPQMMYLNVRWSDAVSKVKRHEREMTVEETIDHVIDRIGGE